ncbi:hypothetical protein [Arthrobacter sp. 9MFCol3.1]|uniref:hypothetical protein n=1 Tax=Arthrobacter sp. 9MFCol3.1 TaxID=1150398 RepID=UPI00047A042D|nr:hypothetical protein [Arthrobacter sp. 9MFCol3.1]
MEARDIAEILLSAPQLIPFLADNEEGSCVVLYATGKLIPFTRDAPRAFTLFDKLIPKPLDLGLALIYFSCPLLKLLV